MKSIFIFLALVVGAIPLIAQPPHGANKTNAPPCNEEWCDKAEFKYSFCTGTGKFVFQCSSDPNHEPPPMNMVKKATPQVFQPCFQPGTSRFERILVDPSDPLQSNPTAVIFNIASVDSIIRIAESRWTRLCPSQGPSDEYQYCCMPVRFSTRNTDFGSQDVKNVAMLTTLVGDGQQSASHCNISCQRSEIVINQQPDFTGEDANHSPYTFFYTDNRIRVPQGPYTYRSMLALMTHEIGHWFGMGHSDEPDRNGHYCHHDGSIMENGYIGKWDYDRDLTREDICMFMKAYCCARTTNAVDAAPKEVEGLSLTVIPNPARATITLHIPQPVTGNDATMRILSMDGTEVLTGAWPKERTEQTLNIQSFPNGVYVAEVIVKNAVIAHKFLIQR